MTTTRGKIILLNGVSSSGKTTLARALTERMPGLFRLSIDRYDDWIAGVEDRDKGRLIPVDTEHYFHRTVAMFSDSGVSVVVDQILHSPSVIQDCVEVLAGYPVLFVGVHCGLDTLRSRERERGNRTIGQAEEQLRFVHRQLECYDLEVDTSEEPPAFAAERIARVAETPSSWSGWAAWRERMLTP
ncbi:chloramphenicol phosphotransferase CPT family protein [Paenibacillus aurantiacus]|uniref:Chloramphenicol phosphotransferase CPT family protein n=1 Tax=Paenibacillus aurantiacus TaxID=1936118 RepID=A0ABV5KY24_9BACL